MNRMRGLWRNRPPGPPRESHDFLIDIAGPLLLLVGLLIFGFSFLMMWEHFHG